MLISIILTCYKQEKFIEEAILSIINQSFKDRELLIWDDSPDDNCRKIISKYTKKYPNKIHAWHHNPNKWIVNNMQFLIEHRSKESEYVAFLEWDDCLFPEYLEKKLDIFKNHPNVQLVYNELTTIDEKWKIINERELKMASNNIWKKWKINYEKLISQIYYMSRSTLMIRSEMLNKYKIHSKDLWYKTILSDVYFFNQIAHNEDIYWIEEPLIYYRIHRDSMTKNMHGIIIYHLELIKYIECLHKSWLIKSNIYKNQICKCCLVIAVVTVKRSLTMWAFRTLSLFLWECLRSLKYRLKRLFKRR